LTLACWTKQRNPPGAAAVVATAAKVAMTLSSSYFIVNFSDLSSVALVQMLIAKPQRQRLIYQISSMCVVVSAEWAGEIAGVCVRAVESANSIID